jgi:hypothetical protein
MGFLRKRGFDLDEWRRRSPTSELSVGSSRVAEHTSDPGRRIAGPASAAATHKAQPEEPLHSFPLG